MPMSTKERANLILSTLDGKIGYSGEHPQEFVQSQIETAIAQDRMSRPDVEIRHENQDRLTLREDPASGEMTYRSLNLRADTWDDASNSVTCTLSSEDPVTVFDWERGMIDEVLLADGGQYPSQMPMLDAHQRSSVANVLGSIREPQKTGSGWTGRLHFVKGDPASDSAALKVKQRHITDVSIGYRSTKFVDIPAGQTATVNGKQYTARADRDLRVTTAYTPREASLVPIGADQKAKIRGEGVPQPTTAPAESGRNGVRMNPLLRKYLESLGLRAEATEADAQAFAKMLGVSQRSIADDITGGKIKTDAELAVRTAPASPPPSASATPATLPVAQPNQRSEETIRAEALKAERDRINTIRQLAGTDAPAEMVQRAIDENWTTERAGAAILEHVRGKRPGSVPAGGGAGSAPGGIVRDNDRDCNIRTLGLAMAMRSGVTEQNIQGHYQRQGITIDWKNVAEQAHRFRSLSMVEVCREGLRIAGRECPVDREEMIRASVSTGAVADIFTTSVNAMLMQKWLMTDDTTVGWCNENEVNNFQTQDRTDFISGAGLKKLPRGQEASHATATDVKESYKIARYARQFQVDEQDIIDDRFDVLVQMPQEFGMMARQLRPDLIYSIIHANAALNGDGVALFDASTHKNYATGGGTALSADSLQAGIVAMAKQTYLSGRDRKTLNIKPAYLVVPQDLMFTADILLRSAVRIIASASGGTYNPLADQNITRISDNRMGVAGATDPVTETVYAGTATKWMLVASAGLGRTIEVGYLRGTNRSPRIRSFVLDKGRYGMGWDVSLDIGAKALDYRGFYQGAGA